MSLLIMPLGPLSELFYFHDYWRPESIFPILVGPLPIYIEDLLWGFFAAGGIASVIYEVVFRKALRKKKQRINTTVSFSLTACISTAIFLGLFLIGVPSIFASSIAFLIFALFIFHARRDLFLDALYSGFLFSGVMFISYLIVFNVVANTDAILRQGWLLQGSVFDIRILGIPLTELIWGFSWGMMVGPLYEYWKRKRVIKNPA